MLSAHLSGARSFLLPCSSMPATFQDLEPVGQSGHVPVIPGFQRLRQENCLKFIVSLGYSGRLCLKKKKKKKKAYIIEIKAGLSFHKSRGKDD